MARERHPGQRNTLDALCTRYHVDNSRRELHGALLDAEILADVFLHMTGGQSSLLLSGDGDGNGLGAGAIRRLAAGRVPAPVLAPTTAELEAHRAFLQDLTKASGRELDW